MIEEKKYCPKCNKSLSLDEFCESEHLINCWTVFQKFYWNVLTGDTMILIALLQDVMKRLDEIECRLGERK